MTNDNNCFASKGHSRNPISVIICLYKRLAQLEEQLEAILSQSIPPAEIILLQNESHLDLSGIRTRFSQVKIVQSDINSLYTRWLIGYVCEGEYIAVLDDDCIIGTQWLENCLRCSREHNCMVGPSGRVYKGNDYQGDRFFDRVGLEENFEIRPYDKDVEVDWVCNSYFFKKEWIQYVARDGRHNDAQKYLDDIQFAKSLLKYGGIRTFVPIQPKSNKSLQGYLRPDYGDDEHALWRQWELHRSIRREYLQYLWNENPAMFLVSRTGEEDNRFIVVVPFYNGDYLNQCLGSLSAQSYTNWKCVVVDDHSPSGLPHDVQELIENDNRFTVIRNDKREYALRSRELGVEALNPDDEDVIVHLDGDDWLADEKALATVNENYSDGDVWLTYGNCQRLVDGQYSPMPMYALSNEIVTEAYGLHRPFQAYPEEVVQKADFRFYPWCGLHLRTFKYKLLRRIDRGDFLDDKGNYFRFATDMAVMIPMLEMAQDRIRYIPEVLYIYNLQGEQHVRNEFANDHSAHNAIRQKKKYARLE